uniref:T9SS type A sorting domain-containing protein n=1 Tax=candidate division WOR-3 bacterium TaxID=2052148 RepID=A0A7C6A8Z5_UNCW3
MPTKFMLILAILVFVGTSYTAPRMVVGEMFTNTSCGPCYSANLTLNQIAIDCSTYLAVIRYHTWWPSAYDPFYYANITENRARTQFYGTNYVPRLMVDGFLDGGSTHSNWRNLIDGRAAVESPFRIVVTAQFEGEATNARAIAKIYNESNQTITGRLYFVLTETGIYWPAPNGSTIHNQAMHDMIPDQNGELVTIPANDSLIRQRDFVIRDTTWLDPPSNTWPHITAHESCQVVVFIQNATTKEIYQGGKAWLTKGLEIQEKSKIRSSYSSSLKAFPNPFSIILNIITHNPEVRLYDACGNLIKTFYGRNITWDSRGIRPGVYFVENENSRVKILKAR